MTREFGSDQRPPSFRLDVAEPVFELEAADVAGVRVTYHRIERKAVAVTSVCVVAVIVL